MFPFTSLQLFDILQPFHGLPVKCGAGGLARKIVQRYAESFGNLLCRLDGGHGLAPFIFADYLP